MKYTRYNTDHSIPRADTPRANILSDDKGMTIELEVPGFSRSDITVETKESTLTVTAKRSDEAESAYRMQEFNTRHLTRAWALPKSIDLDKITASYDAGILTMSMPYRSDSIFVTRRIEIG